MKVHDNFSILKFEVFVLKFDLEKFGQSFKESQKCTKAF